MIIDELIVKLKLDLGRFRSDAQSAEAELNRVGDASRRTARNMESDGNFMASGFGKVRNQLLSILGLFTAGMGIKNFTQSTIKQADAFGFMSDSIGLSTTRLRAYSDAAESAGGSGEAMTAALKKSAEDVALLQSRQKTLAEIDQSGLLTRWSVAAGLDPSKIFQSGESLLQARLKIFDTIRKTNKDNPLLLGADPSVLAAAVLEQGGVGAGVTNALKNKGGLEGFNKSVADFEKINAPLAGAEEGAREARSAWFMLEKQFSIVSQQIVVSLTPAMTKLTDVMAGIKLPSSDQISKTISEWAIKTEVAINRANEYAKAIGGFSSAWDMVSAVNKKVMKALLPDLESAKVGFELIRKHIPDPDEVESIITRWNKKLESFKQDFLTPANQEAGKFTKTLAEDWKKGFQGLLDLDIQSWTTKVGSFIDRIKELYNLVKEQTSETAGKAAALFGDSEAKSAAQINEKYEPSGEVRTSTSQRQMMSNVYAGFRKAGLTDKQARVMTAQVGRENDFNEKTIFGYHDDPARGVNVGMMSWQGGRGAALEEELKAKGLMKGGKMEHSQAVIDAQTAFAVNEMKGKYRGKLGKFFDKENASWGELSEETGRNYVGWAYGQDTIRKAGGERVPFNWRAQHEREAGYYNKLDSIIGSQANPNATMPSPIIIPKGDKDINGRVVSASNLYQSMPPIGQTSPRINPSSINIGSQTFNIKANDTEGIKKELANKMIISESLTQNFNSGMR